MYLISPRKRFTLKTIVVLTILLAVLLQQVAAIRGHSELPDREHMAATQDVQDMNMENALNAFFGTGNAANTFDDPNTYPASSIDKRRSSTRVQAYRKGCIRRNGACDNRPGDCCFSSSCRCNLWGSNCRCQRMGLFQKWG